MELLTDVLARHAVVVLLAVSLLILGAAAVSWRLVERFAPPVWRLASQAWNAFQSSALVARIGRVRWIGALLTRTLSTTRFLGLYAIVAFVLAIGAAAAFVELVDEIGFGEDLGAFDVALSAALREHLSSPTLKVFSWLTTLGSTGFLVGLVAVVGAILLWRKQWLLAGAWAAATASGGLLNRVLKWIFARERPIHDHGFVTETGWSFPSGHASGSMLVYGLLGYLIVRHTSRAWHLPVALATAALVVFVGSSRVLLQVHYFSDVLAGYASAAAWALLWIAALEAVKQRAGVAA